MELNIVVSIKVNIYSALNIYYKSFESECCTGSGLQGSTMVPD